MNKESEELIQAELDKLYGKRVIFNLFLVIFFANMIMNIDHGALPACYEQLMIKLDINLFKYGILGSSVFLGLMVGSIFSTALYSRSDYIKKTLIGSLILGTLCLFAFTRSENFILSLFLRFMTGFFQIFLMAYQPVWSDTFCAEKFKSIALTINMLASPLGIVGGYMLTYYMNKHLSWEWSFYIESFGLIPCIVILIMTPAKYLNVEEFINVRKRIQDKVATDILARFDADYRASKTATTVTNAEADEEQRNFEIDVEEHSIDSNSSTTSKIQLVKTALIEN